MLKYSSSSKHPLILCHIVPVIKTKLLSEDVVVTHNYPIHDTIEDEECSDGMLKLFDMNPACEDLLPNVKVVSKHFQKEALVYYCC